MIDKLKKNNFYIKYGIIIIFIAVITILTVKIISYGDSILSWGIYEIKRFFITILPVIYAILFSYILYQPIKFIEKNVYKYLDSLGEKYKSNKYKKLIRIFSVIVVLLLVIIGMFMIYNFLVPPILRSIKEIINLLPQFQEQLKLWINEALDGLNDKNIDIQSTGKLSKQIIDIISKVANGVLNKFIAIFSNLSSFIVDFVVTVILTIYFLIDKERIINQVKKLRNIILPNKFGNMITLFLVDLDNVVGRFIVGEVLDSIIVGIVSTILLLIIKHPFAILIGFIAGVTNIIPYIGPILGAALAFFFGVFTSVSLGVVGAILLLLYQQVDGNLIQPKIVGDKIGLSPVWVLIAVLIGGSYFGAIGMILSMPIAGLLRVYLNRYGEYKKIKHKN